MFDLTEKLWKTGDLSNREFLELMGTERYDEELVAAADQRRRQYYGEKVYIRGLIEISNYCKNDCYYCGIRKSNRKAVRYRMEKEEILECCKTGYDLGFRTFVLQGGEDPYFTDQRLCDILRDIRESYPDCAVTLSLGERTVDSFRKLFEAGADRYLLRQETAGEDHYRRLHPAEMSLENRKSCLFSLKEKGYQVGAGFMVGSPEQTRENLLADLRFLQELEPDMIGIGPFLPHHDTPFREFPKGSLTLTLRMLAILRLMFPWVLLPATTALATLHPKGRELGLKAGANVIMPNLSSRAVRGWYELYDHKLCTGMEAAEEIENLRELVARTGYQIVTDRGDPVRRRAREKLVHK